MSIWSFGILTTICLLIILTIIGVLFRTKQYKVDLAYMYLENKEQLKTDLLILDAIERFYPTSDPKSKAIHCRINELRKHLGVEG